MEVELNFIEELLDRQVQKIEDFKNCNPGSTVCESLEEDVEKLRDEYEKICGMYVSQEEYEEFRKSRLDSIQRNCKMLKEEMASVLPSWVIPQEPILSDEDTRDFLPYVEWLYGYIGYLVCLKTFRPEAMTRQFGNRLYGLKRELSELIKVHRYNYTTGKVWEMSIKLREKIHNFDLKSTDVVERYLKEKNTGESPVDN